MAKIRVYELARDLNMKNKELLDKLEELNVTVRSHMSSLDDDTVAQIRSNLREKSKPGVEVTRVKRTVIRRRKKIADAEHFADTPLEAMEMEEVADETRPEKEDIAIAEVSRPEEKPEREEAALIAGTGPERKEEEKPRVRDDIGPDLQATVGEEAEIAERDAPAEKLEVGGEVRPEESTKPANHKKRKKKKKFSESSARIISKPEPEKTEPRPVKTDAEEEKELVPYEKEFDSPEEESVEASAAQPEKLEPLAETEELEESEPGREPEPDEKAVVEPVEEESAMHIAQKEPKPGESEEKPETKEQPKGKSKQKPPKKKKAKKDTPAKIIQLPSKPVPSMPVPSMKEPEEEVVREKFAAAKETPAETEIQKPEVLSETEKLKDRKKKKRGKQVLDVDEKEKKLFKKKLSFNRKEIVEGSALYATDKKGRKGKKGGKAKVAKGQKTQITTPKAIKRRIKIDDAIVLADLAKRMGIKASEMIAKLMGLGVMVTVNQTIDYDTAALVAAEFGYEVERASFEEDAIFKVQQEETGELVWRPPVVTIMGHVDHGKTSLLDVIRKTRITEVEAGGITQHIGAYHVQTEKGNIVFLDTPGHEAFTAMRARGAKVTDIVVLVVAADDGVMPQTIEAINHSKASKVPIIVAVNKIDKNNAEPDRVKRQLADLGLAPEEWGGETIYVQVSAKQNIGIDDLLDMILLQSEILELKANPDKLAFGNVIEAKLDAGRGPVATVLVKEGTLRAGAPIVCGVHHGKIRAMLNDRGQNVESAGPSMPVEILGLTGVPEAGDELMALTDEKDAKQVSEHRTQKQRSVELAKTSRLSLEKLYERMQQGEVKDLNLIIKADVHGSIEALKDSLTKLSNEEVKINIGHAATGTITESDVSLAAVSNAIIIGFNVRPSPKVLEYAQEEHVEIKFYNVIYNAIKDVKDAILGMMESTFEERTLGRAEVRDTFHVPKIGTIAGCYVTDGKIERNKLARLVRDGVVIFEGKINSLKRYKDDHKEVASGYECGIGLENYNDIKIGDVLECYYMEEIRPELE